MDKYGKSLIENEVHVNKNILRPTRSTRDRIEILSRIKYQEPTKRGKYLILIFLQRIHRYVKNNFIFSFFQQAKLRR